MKIFYDKLPHLVVHPEGDDFHIASMMLSEMVGPLPEFRMMVLARWVARLRETYVEIGRDLGRDDFCP